MFLSIRETDPTPIYLQIAQQIKEQVLVGELRPGDELPSVRELGDALGISLHTARSAYQALADVGLLRIRLGKKTRIAGPGEMTDLGVPKDELRLRLREWLVDGLLQGETPESLHGLLDGEMESLQTRGAVFRAREADKEST
jgi:GntR family transcriptional regulator